MKKITKCGIILLTSYLDRTWSYEKKIVSIEENSFATHDALINKELNNLRNINFICGESGNTLNNIKFNPDVIIVDPPRNGLSKEAIQNILKF